MAEANSSSTLKRDFSRVVLTLDNVVIPNEKLVETPSMQDGLDKDVEVDLRVLGCELIQTAGILLKLPQVGGGYWLVLIFLNPFTARGNNMHFREN